MKEDEQIPLRTFLEKRFRFQHRLALPLGL